MGQESFIEASSGAPVDSHPPFRTGPGWVGVSLERVMLSGGYKQTLKNTEEPPVAQGKQTRSRILKNGTITPTSAKKPGLNFLRAALHLRF